jgi:molybdopterin converting factor small subunit
MMEDDEILLGPQAFTDVRKALGGDPEQVEKKVGGFMKALEAAFSKALGPVATNMQTLALYAMVVEQLTYQVVESDGWDEERYVGGCEFAAAVFASVIELLSNLRRSQRVETQSNIIVPSTH